MLRLLGYPTVSGMSHDRRRSSAFAPADELVAEVYRRRRPSRPRYTECWPRQLRDGQGLALDRVRAA
ncbi:MAG: hypothetical protein A2V77_06705 [Anaeromyxobacter sp. RBG_16_69_14]|nr:MAG: hypothetical protein A2V77_06705 [Anaeromyxobacter sp. RBG_16_69_14]